MDVKDLIAIFRNRNPYASTWQPLPSFMKRPLTLYGAALLIFLNTAMWAQEGVVRLPGHTGLPENYFNLKDDAARMKFLVGAIRDSIYSDRFTNVYEWSRLGYQMAVKNKVDTLKGIFLFDIAKAFTYKLVAFDSAIVYYKRVLPYFPDKLNPYNLQATREIMEVYSENGNKDSTFRYLDILTSTMDAMPDTLSQKNSLSQNIATVYQYFGMYRTAIRYFQIAIMGHRANKNFPDLGIALANLGTLYNEMDDIERGIQYSKDALPYLVGLNRAYHQTASNVAEFYGELNQFDSALHYLTLSNARISQVKNQEAGIVNQNIMALILMSKKKYPEAERILKKNLELLAPTDDLWNLCKTHLNYAALDTCLKRYDRARDHLNFILTTARENQIPIFSLLALDNLVRIANRTGDYKTGLRDQILFNHLEDSLNTEKSRSDLNDLEISYNLLQKEQQIQLLRSENTVKNLELESNRRSLLLYLLGSAFIIGSLGVVLYQRNLRTKMQTQKLRAEMQTQILRSQMNPHFIFNSLNSIENFIMQNDKRQASDYLSKFSILIRGILDSSMNEIVPFMKDIEALKLYIELEQLRFNDKFKLALHIDPVLAGGDYRVPSLLIQPYVENAILHGLAPSEEPDLYLTIIAVLQDDQIRYTIQDNGVGIAQSKEYNTQNKPHHKSVGLKITAERIRMFNGQPHDGAVTLTSLGGDGSTTTGTKVEIILNVV
ncbi:Histidine kinase [Chryseolinea serpens]|uniref:Histidine kinase n=2 Tax=Chryseolinea serpens TaxID=947013 RepID=A0A1M5WUE4_9BACT|nr:Histidine kinase [Chryseolinea serpens]